MEPALLKESGRMSLIFIWINAMLIFSNLFPVQYYIKWKPIFCYTKCCNNTCWVQCGELSSEQIARDIQPGNVCKNHHVSSIFISLLVYQISVHLNGKIKSVNVILGKLCLSNGFLFIHNSNITEVHLADDGSYLKEGGKCSFANNFINILNRFIWNEEACND